MERNMNDMRWWLMLSGGRDAILRFPSEALPPEGMRRATHAEINGVCDKGNPFPWGPFPEEAQAPQLWHKHRVGWGGMIHEKFFVDEHGLRWGGAPNIPDKQPGCARALTSIDGGKVLPTGLEDNMGYAIVRSTTERDLDCYRRVRIHATKHVTADSGDIIMSPIGEDNIVYVGFIGRCLICPNAEIISFEQLKAAVPGYDFRLYPEWKNWRV